MLYKKNLINIRVLYSFVQRVYNLNLLLLSILLILSPLIYSSNESNSTVKQVVNNNINNPKLIGEGRYTYLFWDIFDATLYAPNGKWSANETYALNIKYLLDVDGDDIASNGIDEIRSQGIITDEIVLDRWYKKISKLFNKIKSGTNITGVRDKDGYAKFYKNGKYIGMFNETLLCKHFFNIWLGKKTSAQELRNNLLNY